MTANGRAVVRAALRAPPSGHDPATPSTAPTWVLAIGKAAESMLLGAHDALGTRWTGGLLITKEGHLDPVRMAGLGVECIVGGHPLPNQGSLEAGARLLQALAALPPDARWLVLLSGGASSLVEVPAAGLTLAELDTMNQWLLGSGLPIEAVNLVRKAVSRIKGGGLLKVRAARPTRVLAISDVPNDDPSVIGSGLFVPEPGLAARVSALDLPPWLSTWVGRGLAERAQGSPIVETRAPVPRIELVATSRDAMRGAADAARRRGLPVHVHAPALRGDAVRAGRHLARRLRDGPPGLHVWGGETTVTLPASPGRGGRNQHLALAAAIELDGHPHLSLLSAGTDGSDGPTDDAGAIVDATTLQRAATMGQDARDALARADAGTLLEATGDLIRTGPTGTNVMDLVLGLHE